jgi:hypothetical protein
VRDCVSLALYTVLVARMFGGIEGAGLLRDVGKLAAAAAVTGAVMLTARLLLAERAPALVMLALGGAAGVATYAALTIHVFRIEEAERLVQLVRERLSNLSQSVRRLVFRA